MPPGGIAVDVLFLHSGRPQQHYRSLRLVLPRHQTTPFNGPRDTAEYRIYGRVDGHDLMILVDIRRLHPTKAQLAAARLVVSNIRFS